MLRTARLGIRLPEDLKEQVDRHRSETGVPMSIFVERAIRAALENEQTFAVMRPKRRKPVAEKA